MGEHVTLKDFAGFSGDLDTFENSTGKQSVYTVWRDLEIMYHVATLLPYDPQDSKQLTKRKYLADKDKSVAQPKKKKGPAPEKVGANN